MKKLEAILHRKDGTVVCYPDADLANADWLASRRLLVRGKQKELKEKLDTPMWVEEDWTRFCNSDLSMISTAYHIN